MSTTPVDPIVELQVDGEWINITSDVRQGNADSGGGLEISRGVPNEGNFAEPTQFNFTLNNGASNAMPGESGVYSPTNPMGPWFGKLGRNQRVRVGMDRRYDDFTRSGSVADGWGWLPDRLHADGTTTVRGEEWSYYGDAAKLSVSSGQGRIVGGGLNAAILPKPYADVDVTMRFQYTTSTDSEVGIFARMGPYRLPFQAASVPNNASGWNTIAAGSISTDTTVFRPGRTSSIRLDVVSNGSATLSVSQIQATTHMVPTVNGVNSSYQAGVWLRGTKTGNTRVVVSWFSKENALIGTQTAETVLAAANTWQYIKGTFASPPQDAYYARLSAGWASGSTPTIGDQLWVSDNDLHDTGNGRWYSTSIVPGSAILKVGKVADSVSFTQSVANPLTLATGTWYWLRVQMSGQRIRVKAWPDSGSQPTAWQLRYFDDRMVVQDQVGRTGEVGIFINGGTSTLLVDSVQIDQWRAHTEIVELPTMFDLARTDFWVPVQSRGVLRRLNQGRKSLRSPVTLHLEEYAALSGGWWSLEDDEGDSAGNLVVGGIPGTISGLTFGETPTTGVGALPGVSGVATLEQDTSAINLSIKNHAASSGGKESLLWFMRLPNLPASTILAATIYATGTVRTWYLYVSATGAFQMVGKDRAGATIVDQTVAGWNGNAGLPTGCWIAFNLYIFQNGGNVDWALNHHRPGAVDFWTNAGSFAGTTGIYLGVNFRSSSAHTAAGNLQLTQVLHYAGDLPFVDYDFRKAAAAYDLEEAADRIVRLASNAGVQMTTTGSGSLSVPLGTQSPSKVVELWEESAEADDGFIAEERDDFGLTFVTRNSLWNREPVTLHIDQGHLTTPLESNPDDQRVRNDVTVNRPGGSFRRAIQASGPLNVNEPEADPDGVGTYDEQKTFNVGTDDLCGSHAQWRVSRGTQTAPRYPSFTCDMAAAAYQADAVLAADVMALDPGDHVLLYNTETDYVPRRQQVTAYTERMDDLYSWRIVYTGVPADVRQVGAVNYTTRVGTDGNITTGATFTAGTSTTLTVNNASGTGFVDLTANDDRHWPFEVEVEGVRLNVEMTGVVLNADPGFEASGLPAWTASSANATLARDLFDPKRGTHCLRVTAAAAGTDGANAAAIATVTTAKNYLISGWIKTEVAATDVRLCVDWYITGVYSSTALPTPITTSANVWTWFSAVVTAPASVNGARVRTRNVYAGATRAWYDNVRMVLEDDYTGTGQVLQVTQTPTNAEFGITGKVISSDSVVRVVDAMRIGWGESS